LRNFSAASALNLDIERTAEGPSTLMAPDSKEGASRPFGAALRRVSFWNHCQIPRFLMKS
jgi:hypothetical protein